MHTTQGQRTPVECALACLWTRLGTQLTPPTVRAPVLCMKVGVVQGRLQVQEQQGCVVQVVEQQQGQAGQAQEQQVEADAAPAGAGAAPEFAGLPPFLRDAVTQGRCVCVFVCGRGG